MSVQNGMMDILLEETIPSCIVKVVVKKALKSEMCLQTNKHKTAYLVLDTSIGGIE